MMDRKSDDPLFSVRINSLIRKTERYECGVSRFLTPKEQIIAREIIIKSGTSASAFFYGGYDGSERNRLFVLPMYMALDEYSKKALDEAEIDIVTESVQAVKIMGSGYIKLSHRDYLGSLLGLGIERDVVGDVAVLDGFSAVVFCDGKIAEFILSELKKVGNDTVRVSKTEVASDFCYEPQSVTVSDTVASARLDCVVAALSGLAREKAQHVLKSGSVALDYFTADECDAPVSEGSVISIRGVGKFKILSLSDTTKKGRLRLLAKKYI